MTHNALARVIEPYSVQLDQARLNILNRSRTSRLPWRGQFSPELVEHIMERVCDHSATFLDPFAGSGTVLFEALKRGRSAIGLEVNPAAWHLAVLASLGHSNPEDLQAAIQACRTLAKRASGPHNVTADDLTPKRSSTCETLALAAVTLLSMGNKLEAGNRDLARGATAVLAVLNEVAEYGGDAHCFLRDARKNGLEEASVDAVITSPPYVNVFNYHQNYRPACELLGWKPLEAARSEIGANRKHRQNRFLTVVQYCIDMHDCLVETARTMANGAPLVIVLGRTSNVLGTAFENGRLIKEIIENCGCYGPVQTAERLFVGRFGDNIYEDVLIAYRTTHSIASKIGPREIGIAALQRGRSSAPEKNIALLDEAIALGPTVQPSPMLNITVPNIFI